MTATMPETNPRTDPDLVAAPAADPITDAAGDALAEEVVQPSIAPSAYDAMLARLSHQSVVKHFDAYADIAWDSPDFEIRGDDPRWILPEDDALGATAWYQALDPATQARLGLDLVASKMKIGLIFEGVLKQGLLQFAGTLPNGSPEFRYAYHEVIEEAHHSLMFQEFVNRSGFDAAGLRRSDAAAARVISTLGRRFPPLFFVFVLGGEDPIDYVQRRELRSGRDLHPLLERIMRIHVTEEARHLSFARQYLKQHTKGLSIRKRRALGIGAPIILAVMAQMMLKPSPQIIERYDIPKAVITEAFDKNERHREQTLTSLRKVRQLIEDLGLLTPSYRRLWKSLGLWQQDAS